MATNSYVKDLLKLSRHKEHKAKHLVQIVLIKSLIRTTNSEDLSYEDITHMLEMRKSVGDLLRSLRQPRPRRRMERYVSPLPKPISPLARPQTPLLHRTSTEEPETKRRRINKELSVIAEMLTKMAAENDSDSDQ